LCGQILDATCTRVVDRTNNPAIHLVCQFRYEIADSFVDKQGYNCCRPMCCAEKLKAFTQGPCRLLIVSHIQDPLMFALNDLKTAGG
jgi:hypothetical protein